MVSTGLVQRTLTGEIAEAEAKATCHCGKVCKNVKGLRIHQSKTRCRRGQLQSQRTVITTGETQEDANQVEDHSVGNFSETVEGSDTSSRGLSELLDSFDDRESQEIHTPQISEETDRRHEPERKKDVKWPKQGDKKAWESLDEDLDSILRVALQGSVEKRIKALSAITYTVGKERFGVIEPKTKQPYKPNRREKEIKQLRQELKSLRRQYLRIKDESKREGFRQLRDVVHQKLLGLRKVEAARKRRRKKERTRTAFISNPYRFTKTLLSEEKSGHLTSSKEETEEYLEASHKDTHQDEVLQECDRILPADPATVAFDEKEPTWQEIIGVVCKARSGSAPGPSGIPYKVYKSCPKLLRRLWNLIRIVWRKGEVPSCWQTAEGCLIPKEKESKKIDQFRTISLLSVEGKIFFSILAKRISTFATANEYINTSSQKGGVPGFSGCLEHTSALTQLIREAQVNKTNLTVVWLDLANAYGSIPHKVIEFALVHYHLPEKVRRIVASYYNNLQLRFSTRDFTTKWMKVERGIITGCTISVILFVLGMNLLLKAAEEETRGPKTDSGIRMPSNRGFMDDITITTETHIQARWILTSLSETASWARMKFKPAKSRSLVIRKGRITEQFSLRIQEEDIPSIKDNPIKCLGKWFDASLKDKEAITKMNEQMQAGMSCIERTGLPGKFKVWMYQNALLPRLIWPLMLYEVTTTTVEAMERTVSKYLRRWLGLPPSFTGLGLYTSAGKLQLPVSSLVEEFKVAKARLLMTLKESPDECISGGNIELRTGRKWSVSQAVETAEARLKHQEIVGTTTYGRQGLGLQEHQRWTNADSQTRRTMVQKEIRKGEEERRASQMVQLSSQGACTRWTVPEKRLTWAQIWHLEPVRISFLLRSVYDLLPTPVNLHRWKLTENPSCSLCGKRGTLGHILSSCSIALTQGRYRWRHDRVLRQLADVLEKERKKKRVVSKTRTQMQFVREGQAGKPCGQRQGILDSAPAWEMRVDLERKLVFPEVVHTTLRPDIVIWSEKSKKIIVIELTVPWEERCDEAYERKAGKYAQLIEDCRKKGWSAWLFPVEVGCRGFPAQTMWRMLTSLGIKGNTRKSAVQAVGSAAEKASSWIWLRREHKSWS